MRREQLATEASSAEVARRSDALKSALIDSVSHDLRTPLATIRATAGGLLDDEVPASAADARRAAETIDREAARLSEVVTNLLDLSRIEGGAIRADVEAHELDDLVRSCVARHRSAFGNRPIDVDVSTALPPVLVDALFFDQALANVLENAVRHAGAAARIRIHADVPRSVEAPAPLIEVREAAARGAASTLDPGDDDHVDLLVEDGGPGVSDTEMPRLFDKFYGRSRAATGGRGVGIGLTVARGLIEAGGGSISAERSSLGGLAIRIRLPFAVGQPSLRPPAPLLVP
jgi:two-component system sensor histidine kinase KdpD